MKELMQYEKRRRKVMHKSANDKPEVKSGNVYIKQKMMFLHYYAILDS